MGSARINTIPNVFSYKFSFVSQIIRKERR